MTEKTLDQLVFERVFGNTVTNETTIPPYSTVLDWSYQIIKFHQSHGGWFFGIKALHGQYGDLEYRAVFRLNNMIAECVADTIEEAVCLVGLMVSDNKYTEYIKDEVNDSNDDIETTSSPYTPLQHISIENKYDSYKILLNCLKNTNLSVGNDNNVTLTTLLNSALGDGTLTLEDMGKVLDSIVKSLLGELDSHNLIIVGKKIEDSNENE